MVEARARGECRAGVVAARRIELRERSANANVVATHTLSFSVIPSGYAFSRSVTSVNDKLPRCIAAMCSGSLPSCGRQKDASDRWGVESATRYAPGAGSKQAEKQGEFRPTHLIFQLYLRKSLSFLLTMIRPETSELALPLVLSIR